MRTHTFVQSALLLTSLWLLGLSPAAAAQQVRAATGVVPVGETPLSKESSARHADGMASGAAEDSLKACLARIPSQATAGQRMLAEQTCQGQQELRTSSHASPQF